MTARKIINGDLPDADDVNDNTNSLMRIIAVGVENAEITTTGQYIYADLSLAFADAVSTEWTYDEQNGGFFGDILLDQIDDSSIDSNYWSTGVTGGGVVAENASRIKLETGGTTGTATLDLDGTSAPDFKTFSGDSKVLVNMIMDVDGGGGTQHTIIRIGSTAIYDDASPDLTQTNVVIAFDKAGETARAYTKDGSALAAAIDISGEGTWEVGFTVTLSGGGGGQDVWIEVYNISYITESAVATPEIITATDTASITSSAIYPHIVGDNLTEFDSFEVSADATNYETTTNGAIINIVNTGTDLRMRLNSTIPTTITDDSSYEAVYMSGYVLIYG